MRLAAPILIVSPHLDDAVLGCGRLIAAHPGSIVVTVFSGHPGAAAARAVTDWDTAAGFGPGDDPVDVRREEDAAALSVLGAVPRWLDFLDHQYRESEPDVPAIAAALDTVLAELRPATVLGPLGLVHPDHLVCAEAVRRLALDRPRQRWVVYEDGLYRQHASPAEREAALAALDRDGARPAAFRPLLDPLPDRKRAAIACYRSQVRALLRRRIALLDVAAQEELYWRIESTPEAPGVEVGRQP